MGEGGGEGVALFVCVWVCGCGWVFCPVRRMAVGPLRSSQDEVSAAAGALRQLGGQLLAVHLVESYSSDGQRTCIAVRKAAPTPAKLPRPSGTPTKKPL